MQTEANAQVSVDSTGVTYFVLADSDHRVAEAYGVYNLLNDQVATPAVFIINPNGQISWSYIGSGVNDRPSVETILANLPSG